MYIFQPDRFLLKKQMQYAASFVRGRVLDVGAGTSDRYSANFQNVDEYVRMDIHAGAGINVVGSADAIPLPDASFDTVVSTQVFEHLSRPWDAAREVYRVLKPGGHAIITVPQMNELHEEPYDFFRYTNFGLDALFSSAGFVTVEIHQRGGYYATLAQLRIRRWIDYFRLYERPMLGRIVGRWCSVYGRYMLWRDARAHDPVSRKHAIGWCIIVRK